MKNMAEESLTYSGAGVDITKGNQAVELMKPLVKSTFRKEVVTDLGGFGGLFAIDKEIQNSKDSSLPSLKHKENSICICFEYSTM